MSIVATMLAALALCQGSPQQRWQELMKQDGVAGALVEVHFRWHRPPVNLKVVRTMYFTLPIKPGSPLMEPASQVVDSTRLERFRAIGLERDLQETALQRAPYGHLREPPPRRWLLFGAGSPPVGAQVYFSAEDAQPPLVHWWLIDRREPPIFDAAQFGDQIEVSRLLASVTQSEKNGVLEIAAANTNLPLVEKALQAGADPSRDGGRVLVNAVRGRNRSAILEIINLLVNAGADPNARDEDAWTPLMWAALEGNRPGVEALLRLGALPNSRGKNGKTALSLAERRGYPDIVQVLQKAGATQ